MPRRRNEERRILGPYANGSEIRYVVVEESGRSDFTFTNKKVAEKWLKKIRDRWSELDDVTVESALAVYKVARMARGTTEESIDESIRRIRLMFVHGSKLIAELDEDYCTESYEALTQKVAVATHQNILIQARSWLRWCKRKKWLRENPLEDVEALGGTANKGKAQHTLNEARTLNGWLRWKARNLDHAAIGILMQQSMALRSGDVFKRIVRDVDMNGTVLRMSGGKTPKSNRPRHVPGFLQPILLKVIEGRDLDEPLFPTEKGTHHTKSWAKAAMKRFCRDAGVRYVCPHSLKGTAGTTAKIVGKTAEEVMEFLSHEDVRTHQDHYEDADAVQVGLQDKLEEFMTDGDA